MKACSTCKYSAVCLTCNGTAWLRVCSACSRVYGCFSRPSYTELPLYFDRSCPLVVCYLAWLKINGDTRRVGVCINCAATQLRRLKGKQ